MTAPLPLKPLHLPDDPSWFPLAWGWWGLLLLLIVLISGGSYFLYQRRQRLKAKKRALILFKQQRSTMTAEQALTLVRQAALSYFPRSDVAGLSGEAWFSFLDQQIKSPRFLANADIWQRVLYQHDSTSESESLINDCHYWLLNALPPKGGRK